MNDAQQTKRPRGTAWCTTGIRAAGTGIILVIIGLLGARLELFGPMMAFAATGIATLTFLVSLIATGVGLSLSKGAAGAASPGRAWAALAASIVAIGINVSVFKSAGGAPAIHDITTDTVNPPLFVAIVPLREDSPNPPEYAGEEVARIQRDAFPDLVTLTVDRPANDVFGVAEQVARDQGWEIVSADSGTGLIEATATTRWIRFKDDVVIRITPSADGTAIDVRSKSRIGQGDMGANARRIYDYLNDLEAAFENE